MLTQDVICTKFKRDKRRYIKVTAEGAVCSRKDNRRREEKLGKRRRKVGKPEVGKQLN